jgi:hypothetical protein
MNKKPDCGWQGFIKPLIVTDVTRREYFTVRVETASIVTGAIMRERLSLIMFLGNFKQIAGYVTICSPGKGPGSII